MYCVFDGGLSVQEYKTESEISNLSSQIPSTEFIRGEGMGGGVGGMVYSIKHPEPNAQSQTPIIICSHANHRGDIIARSNLARSLTSFALYEAYGTRLYEWGDDPDRQKANTKEEETDLNLLNEGMRFRDLETGTFLTRDPIGFMDGPNVYCYVHCNPVMNFDAFGLSETGDDIQEDIIDWASETESMVDDIAAGIANMVVAAVDGVISAPAVIAGQVKDFVADPSMENIPVLGPVATGAAQATSDMIDQPNLENGLKVVASAAEVVGTALGGVGAKRMATPSKGTTPKPSSNKNITSSAAEAPVSSKQALGKNYNTKGAKAKLKDINEARGGKTNQQIVDDLTRTSITIL